MDVIKFPLFPSKIGCILNSQLFYHTATEISEKSKIAETVNWKLETLKSVHHMCAPNIVKIGRVLTEIFKTMKSGRFYWDTVYIVSQKNKTLIDHNFSKC